MNKYIIILLQLYYLFSVAYVNKNPFTKIITNYYKQFASDRSRLLNYEKNTQNEVDVRTSPLVKCSNCKFFLKNIYFEKYEPNQNIGRCSKFMVYDYDIRTYNYKCTIDSREDENYCGKHGKYFSERKPKNKQ